MEPVWTNRPIVNPWQKHHHFADGPKGATKQEFFAPSEWHLGLNQTKLTAAYIEPQPVMSLGIEGNP